MGQEVRSMLRKKKGNIFAKLVVVGLVVYASITLMGLYSQIVSAQAVRTEMERNVAELERINEAYEREIENRYDPETVERIARDRFGLVMPGERTFYAVSN